MMLVMMMMVMVMAMVIVLLHFVLKASPQYILFHFPNKVASFPPTTCVISPTHFSFPQQVCVTLPPAKNSWFF